ncbi:MAG: dihydrodipicolinate synthase family protein, partial [Gemmatimonadales bacterium]
MTAAWEGVFVPITTPFEAAGGDIAIESFRRNVARLLAQGVSGIVVAGSTGEAPLLDGDEQRRLVAAARAEMVDGGRLIA